MRVIQEHPNAVHLQQVFEDDQHYFLVMELCEGGELFDQIIQKVCAPDQIRSDQGTTLIAHASWHQPDGWCVKATTPSQKWTVGGCELIVHINQQALPHYGTTAPLCTTPSIAP